MLFVWIAILAALFLAYANGANDNFKGVSTLLGSQQPTTEAPSAGLLGPRY